MFDVPLDAWYTWLGVATASVVLVGVAAALPTAPPPDAASVANTVDRVAGADYPSTAEHPLAVEQVRVGPQRLGLRSGTGAAHAAFAYGPVTPVQDGSLLERVLYGAVPEDLFTSPDAFARACERARDAAPKWQPAEKQLIVRRLSWEGIHVVLVDA